MATEIGDLCDAQKAASFNLCPHGESFYGGVFDSDVVCATTVAHEVGHTLGKNFIFLI